MFPFSPRQSDGRGPRRHGCDAARVRVSAAKRPERGGARLLATASPEATAWRGGLEGEERLVHVESRNSIVSLSKLFEAFFSWFLTSTAHLSPGSPADSLAFTMRNGCYLCAVVVGKSLIERETSSCLLKTSIVPFGYNTPKNFCRPLQRVPYQVKTNPPLHSRGQARSRGGD